MQKALSEVFDRVLKTSLQIFGNFPVICCDYKTKASKVILEKIKQKLRSLNIRHELTENKKVATEAAFVLQKFGKIHRKTPVPESLFLGSMMKSVCPYAQI